jgi:CubicO group peptidase (beta-lactamase class C family)
MVFFRLAQWREPESFSENDPIASIPGIPDMNSRLARELHLPRSRRMIARLAAGSVAAAPFLRLPAAAHSTPEASPAASPGPSAVASTTGPGELLTTDFADQVATWMSELQVPGAAIGIVHGDRQESLAFGIADIETSTPVTEETLFQVGSISKTYTATALMRFVERGEIDLDATVRTYIPDFKVANPEAGEQVTIRNLVTHTSGWFGDPPIEGTSGDDALEAVIADLRSLPQLAPVGGPFSYNNTNFAILGRILEVVADDTFENVMQANVFDPLGLATSTYTDELSRSLPRIAWPAGGIVSTIGDVLEYGKFHAGLSGDATSVLADAQRLAMQEPLVPGGSIGPLRVDGIGISWFTVEREGARLLLHAGGADGQQSLLIVAPDEEFVFAALTNANAGSDLVILAARLALETILGSAALEDKPGQPLDAETITSYFGTYFAPGGMELTVETAFVAEGPPRMAMLGSDLEDPAFLDSLERDVWFLQRTHTRFYIDFVRDEQEGIAWLRYDGRLLIKSV